MKSFENINQFTAEEEIQSTINFQKLLSSLGVNTPEINVKELAKNMNEDASSPEKIKQRETVACWLKKNNLSDIKTPPTEGQYKGMTPLCIAIEQNEKIIVESIIESSSLDALQILNTPCEGDENKGITPLVLVIEKDQKKTAEKENQKWIFKKIVNAMDDKGLLLSFITPLQIGEYQGQTPWDIAKKKCRSMNKDNYRLLEEKAKKSQEELSNIKKSAGGTIHDGRSEASNHVDKKSEASEKSKNEESKKRNSKNTRFIEKRITNLNLYISNLEQSSVEKNAIRLKLEKETLTILFDTEKYAEDFCNILKPTRRRQQGINPTKSTTKPEQISITNPEKHLSFLKEYIDKFYKNLSSERNKSVTSTSIEPVIPTLITPVHQPSAVPGVNPVTPTTTETKESSTQSSKEEKEKPIIPVVRLTRQNNNEHREERKQNRKKPRNNQRKKTAKNTHTKPSNQKRKRKPKFQPPELIQPNRSEIERSLNEIANSKIDLARTPSVPRELSVAISMPPEAIEGKYQTMVTQNLNSISVTNEESSDINENKKNKSTHPAKLDYDSIGSLVTKLNAKEITENRENYIKALHYHLLRFFAILIKETEKNLPLPPGLQFEEIASTRDILIHVNLKPERAQQYLLELAKLITTQCAEYFNLLSTNTSKVAGNYLNLYFSSLYIKYYPDYAKGNDLTEIQPYILEDLLTEIKHLNHIFSGLTTNNQVAESDGSKPADSAALNSSFLDNSEFCRSAMKMCLTRIGEICKNSREKKLNYPSIDQINPYLSNEIIEGCIRIRNTLGHEKEIDDSIELGLYSLVSSIEEKSKEQLNKEQATPLIDHTSTYCTSSTKKEPEEQLTPAHPVDRTLTSYNGTLFNSPSLPNAEPLETQQQYPKNSEGEAQNKLNRSI